MIILRLLRAACFLIAVLFALSLVTLLIVAVVASVVDEGILLIVEIPEILKGLLWLARPTIIHLR